MYAYIMRRLSHASANKRSQEIERKTEGAAFAKISKWKTLREIAKMQDSGHGSVHYSTIYIDQKVR